MKITDILNYIDNGHMALPEFQRGYVWGGDQVRGLFGSLYRRHPVGGLLVWATQSEGARYRGDQQLAPGVVKLLLDGQQRMTSLYGVIRGKPPKFHQAHTRAAQTHQHRWSVYWGPHMSSRSWSRSGSHHLPRQQTTGSRWLFPHKPWPSRHA